MKIGQRVIHKVTKKQGTIVEIDDTVGKVVFDDGDTVPSRGRQGESPTTVVDDEQVVHEAVELDRVVR